MGRTRSSSAAATKTTSTMATRSSTPASEATTPAAAARPQTTISSTIRSAGPPGARAPTRWRRTDPACGELVPRRLVPRSDRKADGLRCEDSTPAPHGSTRRDADTQPLPVTAPPTVARPPRTGGTSRRLHSLDPIGGLMSYEVPKAWHILSRRRKRMTIGSEPRPRFCQILDGAYA